MQRRITKVRIVVGVLLVVAVGSALVLAIQHRRDAAMRQSILQLASNRGASEAQADIRSGHLIVPGGCRFRAEATAWALRGVECRVHDSGFAGFTLFPPLSEARRLQRSEYDRVMERHLRIKFGPDIFHRIEIEAFPR